jgi:IS1 family transposase
VDPLKFSNEELLKSAQFITNFWILATMAYLKQGEQSIADWVRFGAEHVVRGFRTHENVSALELARTVALNVVSLGGMLVRLQGDEKHACAAVNYRAEEMLAAFGLSLNEFDLFLSGTYKPLVTHLGLRYTSRYARYMGKTLSVTCDAVAAARNSASGRTQHCGTRKCLRKRRAVAVAEHLAEGCSLKAMARLAKVHSSVVTRLNRKAGIHAESFHDERVQDLEIVALEADERHGYAQDKSRPRWEAEVIDPVSKFVLSHVRGQRDEALIRRLLEDAAQRLASRHHLVLFTDGEASYASLFPEIFGQAYRPSRQGSCGRFLDARYRIPRTLAHVQIVKQRERQHVVEVNIRYIHSSHRCVQRVLSNSATPHRTHRPLSGATAPLAA